MRRVKWKAYRWAPWGPLLLEANGQWTSVRAPGSGLVEIRGRSCKHALYPETLEALKVGVTATVDGAEIFTLAQPDRGAQSAEDRAIFVSGAPDVVPDGCFLRQRWLYGVGLETPERRLIRPKFDLFPVPGLMRPVVDKSIHPDLLALWMAASWHFNDAIC